VSPPDKPDVAAAGRLPGCRSRHLLPRVRRRSWARQGRLRHLPRADRLPRIRPRQPRARRRLGRRHREGAPSDAAPAEEDRL